MTERTMTPAASSGTDAPRARILVVDDEIQVVHIFRDLLTQQGYEVEDCDNGDDAILKVTNGKFDLVLTDINLPGVDGLEVIRAAKAADKDTCVIMITGYASTTTAIDALRQGAYDYITKPFDLWETAKAIERGLHSRMLSRENARLLKELAEANAVLQQHEEILKRKVERATHRMASLYEAGKQISTSLSIQSTLDVIVAQAGRLTASGSCLVFLHDTSTDEYAAEAAVGIPRERFAHLRFGMGVGYHGQVVQTDKPILVDELEGKVGAEAIFSALRASSALIVPLRSSESVIGTITRGCALSPLSMHRSAVWIPGDNVVASKVSVTSFAWPGMAAPPPISQCSHGTGSRMLHGPTLAIANALRPFERPSGPTTSTAVA